MTMFCLTLAASFGAGLSKALTAAFDFVAAKEPVPRNKVGLRAQAAKRPAPFAGLCPEHADRGRWPGAFLLIFGSVRPPGPRAPAGS